MARSRINMQNLGKRYLTYLIAGLAVLFGIYVGLHKIHRAADTLPPTSTFVSVDALGRATIRSAADIDWYLGKSQSVPLLLGLNGRNKQIDSNLSTVRELLDELAKRIGNSLPLELHEINGTFQGGDFRDTRRRLQNVLDHMSQSTQQEIGTNLLLDLQDALIRLALLKEQQARDVEALQPPHYTVAFWASPSWSLAEVIFWSWFGVLANLLLNTAQAVSRNVFRPIEAWVGYSKLAYGPVLSVALVLAIMAGWIDLGGFETRVWVLPLLGFIFGFNSRKTADLIDRVSEEIFRAAGDSVKAGPAAVAKRYDARIQAILGTIDPVSFDDLRQKAKLAANQVVRSEAARVSGVHT